ncbi:hypothetical protein EAF04_007015 [Stromatinia cepivora]|nr:hypothetical protein EAF04_007015 [Stromatinia cepivora]
MEDSFKAPEGSHSQRYPLSPPNSHGSTVSSRSLQLPPSDTPINTNDQETSIFSPVSPDTRGEASNPTENSVASMAATAGPSTVHNEGDSHSINYSPMQETASKCNNPLDLNYKETSSGFSKKKKNTSLTSSEHSSGSDAAFYCSVGSPSEEDASSASLCRNREVETALTSTPVRAPTSASTPDVVNDSVVEGEVETRERRSVKGIAQQTSEKISMFLKRLFSRNKSEKDGRSGV